MGLPGWAGVAFAVGRMVVAIVALSCLLPHRSHYAARLAGMLALVAAVCGTAIWACYYPFPELSTTYQPVTQLVAFVALILGFGPLLLLCYDTTPQMAAACAATGYLVQNLAGRIAALVQRALGAPGQEHGSALVFYASHTVCFVVVLAAVVALLWRRREVLARGGPGRTGTVVMVVMVAVVCVASDIAVNRTTFDQPVYAVTLSVAQLLTCVALLYLEYELLYARTLETDRALTRAMVRSRSRQYALGRESLRRTGRLYHDLRHDLARVRAQVTGDDGLEAQLRALEDEVAAYDAMVHTGNKALDTVLAQEALRCEAEGVGFSCVADGSALAFMEPVDVFALFSALLDNCVAASAAAPTDGRSVSVAVRRRGDMVSAHLENHFDGRTGFADGLPARGLAGGAGDVSELRMIRALVGRYDGTLTMGAVGDVFQADVMIPVP